MGYRKVLGLAAVSLAFLGGWCAPAGAADLYSAPQGVSAALPCAKENPCRLDSAITLAVAGDTISLLPGEYFADPSTRTPWPTLPPVEIGETLQGSDPADPPIIHGRPPHLTSLLLIQPGATARDIHVEGTSDEDINYLVTINDGTLERSRVTGTAAAGTNLTICSISNGRIEDTVCHGKGAGKAETLANTSGSANRLVNLLNVTAINASALGNGIRVGMATPTFTSTMNVSNSIARGPEGDLRVGTNSGTAAGSAVMNVEYSNWNTYTESGLGTNILLVDAGNQNGPTAEVPLFVNPGEGDFRPLAGSPTIDAGLSSLNPGPLTLGSTVRLFGTAVDIGANEYVPPPVVTTGAASEVGQAGATLTGSVDPNDSSTTVRFEYGPTSAYGQTVDLPRLAFDAPVTGQRTTVSGLQPGTTYHYRLAATSNGGGEGAGPDRTFTTTVAPGPPDPPGTTLTLSKLKIKKKWRLKKGAVLRFRVSRDARVKLTFDRKKRGKLRRQGVRVVSRKAGANRVRLGKKTKLRRGKRLVPGRYRLTAVAIAPDGARSGTRRVAFRIRR